MRADYIYVTSDFHFNHDKIIEYCNRPRNFEERIVKNMEFLTEEHTLICLGDICIGKDQQVHDEFIKPLKCKKILTIGNHDSKAWAWYMNNGWDFVCDSFLLKVYGKTIKFSHIPSAWDGAWEVNVHGHMHNQGHRDDVMSKHTDEFIRQSLRFISLELTNYRPVQLRKIIERKEKK